ncbi:hypothetical protein FB45DRAFT_878741 [Roridomyces roridus]|uniref:Uncharacterized protein n=1 Tax=Roridomyces roridus TaxID=1738132 RepID=A0AAD7F9W8_9AGAR|nr:hypothetical protein FB45DRAFT_878741 [Roridomyces roridus]
MQPIRCQLPNQKTREETQKMRGKKRENSPKTKDTRQRPTWSESQGRVSPRRLMACPAEWHGEKGKKGREIANGGGTEGTGQGPTRVGSPKGASLFPADYGLPGRLGEIMQKMEKYAYPMARLPFSPLLLPRALWSPRCHAVVEVATVGGDEKVERARVREENRLGEKGKRPAEGKEQAEDVVDVRHSEKKLYRFAFKSAARFKRATTSKTPMK